MIDVVVVDDQALLRGSFRVLVDSAPDLRVVGEAGDGAAAVSVVRQTSPDVVLMDVRMPGMDGIAATREIASFSAARVLILTTFDLDEYVYSALRAGASGFLLKDTPPVELLAAVRVVAAGDGLLSPSVTRRLIAEFSRAPERRDGWGAAWGRVPGREGLRREGLRPEGPGRLEGVTEREREVLGLIARGLSNTEITQELHLSVGTVKTHIGRLLHKLQARDRAQLVIAAYEAGLVTPNV
ncbi:DNA-binding NarL/FixJ family response regulator [Saccharothrix tamanrassetensis]|uniref:DNA-binding NarL/FixJ family response regulator n=1 Tax=Saccharothrix tamanrassetensis TaxID=1051531 RepID=A0A841CEE3_9PSEU|nr:response regulator transcription factor [Saccharothrix tamanrassetensis]MBB5954116.1 DNA-binding NarL/FixJ family response regulator [Saccharothrix tamanrassetensis]